MKTWRDTRRKMLRFYLQSPFVWFLIFNLQKVIKIKQANDLMASLRQWRISLETNAEADGERETAPRGSHTKVNKTFSEKIDFLKSSAGKKTQTKQHSLPWAQLAAGNRDDRSGQRSKGGKKRESNLKNKKTCIHRPEFNHFTYYYFTSPHKPLLMESTNETLNQLTLYFMAADVLKRKILDFMFSVKILQTLCCYW